MNYSSATAMNSAVVYTGEIEYGSKAAQEIIAEDGR
jgi:hypothetical protein